MLDCKVQGISRDEQCSLESKNTATCRGGSGVPSRKKTKPVRCGNRMSFSQKSLLCITSRGLRYRFALFKDSQVSQFYTVSVKNFIVLIFSFLLFSKQCSLLKQAKKQGNTQAPMFYRIQHKERTKSKTKSQAIRISQNSIFLFYIQGHTV